MNVFDFRKQTLTFSCYSTSTLSVCLCVCFALCSLVGPIIRLCLYMQISSCWPAPPPDASKHQKQCCLSVLVIAFPVRTVA